MKVNAVHPLEEVTPLSVNFH